MSEVVIVAAGRSAIGSFSGTLPKVPAADLGAHVIRKLLARAAVETRLHFPLTGQILHVRASVPSPGCRERRSLETGLREFPPSRSCPR